MELKFCKFEAGAAAIASMGGITGICLRYKACSPALIAVATAAGVFGADGFKYSFARFSYFASFSTILNN